MGEDLAVIVELEFGLDESIRELSGIRHETD